VVDGVEKCVQGTGKVGHLAAGERLRTRSLSLGY
jgi:hypothetical protein